MLSPRSSTPESLSPAPTPTSTHPRQIAEGPSGESMECLSPVSPERPSTHHTSSRPRQDHRKRTPHTPAQVRENLGLKSLLAPYGAPGTPAPAQPPACNTGVGFTYEDARYGWDWTATTHNAGGNVLDDLLRALGAKVALPGKGLQGWPQSVKAYDAGGYLLGSVYFGGGRDDVHVVSTSAAADAARPAVVGIGDARTARVDTRVDTLLPFEDLVAVCEGAAMTYGSRITRMESSERGESLGRTVYLGSPSSAVRVRVYEKWLESPGQYVEGTNRVEVQLRPASKVKARVSAWSPAETFCASKVTRDLAERLGDDMAPKVSLHVKRDIPDLERTLRVMGDQYGNAVDRFLSGGGDLSQVLAYMIEGSR